MEALEPGHYWKTPFIWEPGCPAPPATSTLTFEPAQADWLPGAFAQVMADSLDESDKWAVAHYGPSQAVAEFFALVKDFRKVDGWWRAAVDSQGHRVGFVLPVLFLDEGRWKDDRPQGTIFYMGVLPGFRGRGYAFELIAEATRLFIGAQCWRILCDTGTHNHPMIEAFRKAGYKERTPWQRSLA